MNGLAGCRWWLPSLVGVLVLGAVPVGAGTPRVVVDNGRGNEAATGRVADADPAHAKVGVANVHSYWTNVVVNPPSGAVTLKPALGAGGTEVGGIYASWAVIAPNGEAVWTGTFDRAGPASVLVQTTPSLEGGGEHGALAGTLNVLTILAQMFHGSPHLSDVNAVFALADLVEKAPDLAGTISDLGQGAAPLSLVGHLFNLMNDPAQVVILQQALEQIGVLVTTDALKQLLTVKRIYDLAAMAYDMGASAVLGHSAAQILFSQPDTAPTTTTTTMASTTTTTRSAIATTDWRNTSYTTDCGEDVDHPFKVDVREGFGDGLAGEPDHYLVGVLDVQSGQLAGDGTAQTAVLLQCDPEPSNYFRTEIQVFTGNNLIATLRPPDLHPEGLFNSPYFDDQPLLIRNGHLESGAEYYGSQDCHACGPSIHHDVSWTWQGGQFRAQGGPVLPVPSRVKVPAVLPGA